MKKHKGKLNQELDYAEEVAKLKWIIKNGLKLKTKHGEKSRRSKAAILLIMILNACRVSEAQEAFNAFQDTGQRLLKIRTRKRGYKYKLMPDGHRRRLAPKGSYPENPDFREVVIPDCISQDLPKVETCRENMTVWCTRWMHHCSHALRYAGISHMVRTGMSPLTIRGVTHHANLQMVAEYVEESVAHDALQARLEAMNKQDV